MTEAKTPVRQRTYSPSEFAAALKEAGVNRSERWVQYWCAKGPVAGGIKTLPLPGGRYEIPESELRRLVYSAELPA